eukprot:CAMPEP_0201564584 /NCGR_PEP_ID=MMETSP0190_2-20130828/3014_1 /ASSEMBLY_ACC=CAM_ASM_000263 /TAXON_ID=37353 /ORGANISM="Rosalina sp." /LENGTH=636 /DNA_ID=CAMNT_0047980963 /DNA_START=29 /DNA_END=1939 /DNA_ORIENTATION=-
MASLLIVSSIISVALSDKVTVDTNYGTIAGIEVGNLYKFMNIPFAEPPIDELRFMPPQPYNSTWNDNTWDGQAYGQMYFGGYAPACIQEYYGSDNATKLFGPYVVTEDCLYLNVFTPNTPPSGNSSYAVMVWIYGGSFVSGWSTGGFVYDPTETIDYIEDVIIVSINYRVGLLGGFYDNMYDTGIEGNQGFMDQKMAIEWVYENIEYFGGDPERMTIYGESAGAHSVALHLLYNNELLQGGIMESPPIGLPLRTPTTWYDVPQQLSMLIGCYENDTMSNDTDMAMMNSSEILDCWQSVSWNDILMAQRSKSVVKNWYSMPFTPTAETDLIPYQPVEGFMNSNLSENVPPYIVGVNMNESNAFLNTSLHYTYEYVYYALLVQIGQENTEMVFDYYGIDDMNATDLSATYAQISTDSAFKCPVRAATNANVNNDAWYYHFDVVDTELYKTAFFAQPRCQNATCHTAELWYIFLPANASQKVQGFEYDNETLNIGHQLQTYWTNFAKTMDPNEGKEVWENYETNSEQILEIVDDNFNHSIYLDDSICDLWDKIGYAGNYFSPTSEPTSEPTEPEIEPNSPDSKTKLSTGAIVGIVIGGICVVIILAYVIGKCVFDRKRSYKKDEVLMADRTNYRALTEN